jgi:hypothetical protein
MKKASRKSKGKTSRPAKKKASPKSKKPVDLAEVRKDITNIVGSEAAELAQAVVAEGRKGQLAPVKYLFEAIGLYPAPQENQPNPEEASLARTLLHRLGIPVNPVIRQEDEPPMKLNPAADKCGNEEAMEKDSGIPGAEPASENQQAGDKDANEDNDVPVLAESIP